MALNLRFSLGLVAATALLAPGCSTERDTAGLSPEPPNTDPTVFLDGFTEGLDYQSFDGPGIYFEALSIDTETTYGGSAASLKFTVPPGRWAGGAFPNSRRRDLSGYDALTFWAKASRPTTIDIVGFGNNNTGLSKYAAGWGGFEVTKEWKKYVVPIPLPSKLLEEDGLLFFADGDERSVEEYSVWIDEVQFQRESEFEDEVGPITDPRPAMNGEVARTFAGLERRIRNTRTTFQVGGQDQEIGHEPGYFTFFSSNEAVATVAKDGTITTHAGGSATITAKLGDLNVSGSVTLDVRDPDPSGPAPAPPQPPAHVISLFSDAYDDIPVDEYSTSWDNATVFDLAIAGDRVKVYEFESTGGFAQPYAAIDFAGHLVDAEAAGMTHLHLDLWIPGTFWVKIKLVDFGSDGIYTSGSTPQITPCHPDSSERDISQHEAQLLIDDPDVSGVWSQVDLPLSEFFLADPSPRHDCMRSQAHLAQIIITVANGQEIAYVDNVYFYR